MESHTKADSKKDDSHTQIINIRRKFLTININNKIDKHKNTL